MNSSGASQLPSQIRELKLSDQERQLAILVARGLANGAIARECNVSAGTITKRIARLMQTLSAQYRVEILFYVYSESTMCRWIGSASPPKFGGHPASVRERKAG